MVKMRLLCRPCGQNLVGGQLYGLFRIKMKLTHVHIRRPSVNAILRWIVFDKNRNFHCFRAHLLPSYPVPVELAYHHDRNLLNLQLINFQLKFIGNFLRAIIKLSLSIFISFYTYTLLFSHSYALPLHIFFSVSHALAFIISMLLRRRNEKFVKFDDDKTVESSRCVWLCVCQPKHVSHSEKNLENQSELWVVDSTTESTELLWWDRRLFIILGLSSEKSV